MKLHAPTTIYSLLENQAKQRPHHLALIGERAYTYREFLNSVLSFVSVLRSKYHVKPKQRVGIYLPNIPEHAIALFALNRIGAIAVVLNIRLDESNLRFIIEDAGISLLITQKDSQNFFKKVFPAVQTIAREDEIQPSSAQSFSTILKQEYQRQIPTGKDDVALLMYTSGTTGTPKGAMMTNANLLFNCASSKRGFGLTKNDIHLIVVPLFHVTGLNSQLLASIAMGSTAILLKKYDTAQVMRLLKKYNVTIFIAVPAVFNLLIAKYRRILTQLEALQKIGYAGAPMPVRTILTFKKYLPRIQCYNFYGLTETSSITTVLPDRYALKTPDSVGIPAKGVQIKIVDEHGKEVAIGEQGELWIKGGNIVKGYWNNVQKTKETITNGWLHSGDIARIDQKRRVFLMGRKKEVINRGGEKIYPITLENKLCNHPKIVEAAVVGVPDKIFGEAVRVYIVKKASAHFSEEEFFDYCRSVCSEYEIPRDVIFIPELPRNANGKVQKDILRTL